MLKHKRERVLNSRIQFPLYGTLEIRGQNTMRFLAVIFLLATGSCTSIVEQEVTDTSTLLQGLRVTPESGRDGYQRPSWNVPDTEIHARDGSPACTAYSRMPITDVGPGDGLDREHIVALAEAWDSRPPGFSQSDLQRIANDHDNLTLARASINRSKSDHDAAGWQPKFNGAWMAHRIVEVKRKYDLSIDPAERDWLVRLLESGPDQIVC